MKRILNKILCFMWECQFESCIVEKRVTKVEKNKMWIYQRQEVLCIHCGAHKHDINNG